MDNLFHSTRQDKVTGRWDGENSDTTHNQTVHVHLIKIYILYMLWVILLKKEAKSFDQTRSSYVCACKSHRDQLLAQESAAHVSDFQVQQASNFVIRKMHGTIAKDTHDDAVHV
jgi:hypothetical protein